MKNDSNKDNPQNVPAVPKQVLGKISPGSVDTELKQEPDSLPKVQPQTESAKAHPQVEPAKGLGSLRKSKGNATSPSPSPADASSAAPDSHRYGPPVVPVPATPLTPPAAAACDDRLVLPEGALVAMRRSGGFRFSSREVVIYHDGRVAVDSDAAGQAAPVIIRRLSYKDLSELYNALDGANFPQPPAAHGHQNADAYAYEIVTRSGTALHSVEVFDGTIPTQLAPLLRFLVGCMKPGQ